MSTIVTAGASNGAVIPCQPKPAGAPAVQLRDFLAAVGAVLQRGLPSQVWIEATVAAAKAGAYGHTLELVDPDPSGTNAPAQLRVFLSNSSRASIGRSLGMAFEPLQLTSLTATLLIEPSFHPKYHLQARIIGLAHAMQHSLRAKALDRLREILRQEGLYAAQRKLPPPRDVTRIAVIHPVGAAGYADVAAELDRWSRAGIIIVARHTATFEGPRATSSLVAAIGQAAAPIEAQSADIVVIVRGGGDRAGLLALDDGQVARALCRCPVPILTGLGHAVDRSLLDEVAWRTVDTPSKALSAIKGLIVDPARAVLADIATVETRMLAILADASQCLDLARHTIAGAAERRLGVAAGALASTWASLRAGAATGRERCSRMADEAERLLELAQERAPMRIDDARLACDRVMADVAGRARRHLDRADPGEMLIERLIAAAQAAIETRLADVDNRFEGLTLAATRRIGEAERDLASLDRVVDALDPRNTLARGFALVFSEDAHLVATRAAALAARDLTLQFVDGPLAVRVDTHEHPGSEGETP